MEFRVLGSLELVDDGAVRTLPAGAERAVLELLQLSETVFITGSVGHCGQQGTGITR